MTTWSKDQLRKIAEGDDLHISPFREDGVTYGTPTWIWSVSVDDTLYVRGYNGRNSRWYQAAVRRKAGRARPFRDSQGHAARDQCMIIDDTLEYAGYGFAAITLATTLVPLGTLLLVAPRHPVAPPPWQSRRKLL